MPEPDWQNECRAVLGDDAIVTDAPSLLTYENDAFTLVRAAPDAVLFPRDTIQTRDVMRILARHNIPIIPRGAGTSLAGGTVAIGGGACICTSRMRDLIE